MNEFQAIIHKNNSSRSNSVLIIDDDPTGCQTVADVELLLKINKRNMASLLKKKIPFFILTNSRSLTQTEAYNIVRSICSMVLPSKNNVTIISRSDSTLRGHFFPELSAIQAVHNSIDAIVFAPCFFEGGRYTINDIHYLEEHGNRVPVSNTEFSRDRDFSFKNSYLPAYIEEKTNGLKKAGEVISITLEDIHRPGCETIQKKIEKAPKGAYIVVNATNYDELEKVVSVTTEMERMGKTIIYRSGSSLVKTRLGITQSTDYQLKASERAGVIVVGSYVGRTSAQLEYLFQHSKDICRVECSIDQIIGDFRTYLETQLEKIDNSLRNYKSVVVFTERKEYLFDETVAYRNVPGLISRFLSSLVGRLPFAPGFLVAKGGITSHEVARNGLNASRARVLGQVLPGVPVWKLMDGKYPSLEYVVFPGNVGAEDALFKLYQKLSHCE